MKKVKTNKVFWWYDKLYKQNFHIIFGDIKLLKSKYNVVKECLGNINTEQVDAITVEYNNNTTIIHFKKINEGLVAHEALHATNIVLREIGHKADYDNDEPQAYYLQNLVDKIYEFYKEYKKLK